jgi:SAM-dependent methyltransferase
MLAYLTHFTTNTNPQVGHVDFGQFKRWTPFSRSWGYERGHPIDRYYIEDFLSRSSADIKGRVLEIQDNVYTKQFGAAAVTESQVLDVNPNNQSATIIADITNAPLLRDNSYDCVILTQTLQLIYDVKSALGTIHRVLKPGGILLLTVPGISPKGLDTHMWCWSFFPLGVRKLLEEKFGEAEIAVESHGNFLTSVAFIAGLAQEDLPEKDFGLNDPAFPLIITARVVKN